MGMMKNEKVAFCLDFMFYIILRGFILISTILTTSCRGHFVQQGSKVPAHERVGRV